MADDADAAAPPGIAALSPTTARQIGSGQVLVDPSSVVKELIDNALDARAKSIFVDITVNTIDFIQVKDDGHGIPTEDRTLVCRRYCTSKIRDFHDLKEVGGKWLGFRGEALSSLAEMSGTLHVTTRVEGEPVAVRLKYGRNGELASSAHESHPVGTAVKVTSFFEHIPVRKQTAIKNSAKWLAKIRRLMQAYALARPTVRFRLHVLKAKNNKADFVYAPKANANVEDAVLKIIGKDCALQCDWTALETDGFEIHAFLPKPTANGSKIANQGAFVSIDARPVSSSRGTTKQVVASFKDRLRKSNPPLGGVKDPFFCVNIICPPDSYDPNIEPAKDDVMFENGDIVVGAVDKLLKAFYPEAIFEEEDIEAPTSVQQSQLFQSADSPAQSQMPVSVYEDTPICPHEGPPADALQKQPRWRSSMYGIDEDDLEFLQENQPPVIEEEEGRRAADVSNPWTIARMNAAIKPRDLITNGQLLSPAKSQRDISLAPSSPAPAMTPQRNSQVEPLTPQTSSRMNISRGSLDDELERSIQHLPLASSQEYTIIDGRRNVFSPRAQEPPRRPPSEARESTLLDQDDLARPDIRRSEMSQVNSISQEMPPPAMSAPRRSQRRQQAYTNKPFVPPAAKSNDTWFGQPMRGSELSRRQKRSQNQEISFSASDISSSPQRHLLGATERLADSSLYSEDNTDIRDFFGRSRGFQRSNPADPIAGSSFTPINTQSRSSQPRGRFSQVTGDGNHIFPRSSRREPRFDGSSRATSAEPQPRSKHARDQSLLHSDRGISVEPRDMAEQFRAYAERDRPARAFSAESQTSMLFNARSTGVRDTIHMHGNNNTGPGPRNMTRQFQAYENSFSQSPAPRPSSVGGERPSMLPQRSINMAKAPDRYGHDRSTNNARDMEAHFRAIEEREGPPSTHPTSAARRPEPRIAPPHEKPSKSRRLRRRTTDALERTKSSKLPLERVPHGYHMQDVVLPLPTSVAGIIQSSRKLDMNCNSLEWAYPLDDAYDVFVEPVTERKIMDWVIELDELLHERYERVGGVDTRCELHEGIQSGLDARKEQDNVVETIEDVIEIPGSVLRDELGTKGDGGIETVNIQHAVMQVLENADDGMSDFDMSQFVDLDADVPITTVGQDDNKGPAKVADEYDDDIEDEMLLDL